jgi:hypothetical protein
MLAKDAPKKMHLSRQTFSELLSKVRDEDLLDQRNDGVPESFSLQREPISNRTRFMDQILFIRRMSNMNQGKSRGWDMGVVAPS